MYNASHLQQLIALALSAPVYMPLSVPNTETREQVLKCQLRDFVARNPDYVSFLAQRQGLDVSSISHNSNSEGDDPSLLEENGNQSQVVFWERAVGGRLSEMFR